MDKIAGATLNMMAKIGAFLLFSCVFLCSSMVAAEDKKNQSSTKLGEITIIGNTELPNVSFNLPWQLPSVQKRSEQSPTRKVRDMLVPIEPYRHKQQVYFSRNNLKVDVSRFNVR